MNRGKLNKDVSYPNWTRQRMEDNIMREKFHYDEEKTVFVLRVRETPFVHL